MEVNEGSDQKSDISPHWMAQHASLKNEFTEHEKYQDLMTWLSYYVFRPPRVFFFLFFFNSLKYQQSGANQKNKIICVLFKRS